MTDKKKPANDNQPKQDKQRNLNESLERRETRTFSRTEKGEKNSNNGKIEYISKPKISSEDTNNDKKK